VKKVFTYNFIRFGGLSKMDQKNRYGTDTFHAPPKKKGIYAFPEGVVDKFLLTATNDPRNPSNKTFWLKDDNGNRIIDEDFYDNEYNSKTDSLGINKKYIPLIRKYNIRLKDTFSLRDEKDGKFYIVVYKKPRIFSYSDDIWCHLGEQLRPEHIIDKNGSWVKVSMEDYIFALQKEKHSLRRDMMKLFGVDWKDHDPFKHYCTDHLEVFIEKVN
jgi:hypothetical protein